MEEKELENIIRCFAYRTIRHIEIRNTHPNGTLVILFRDRAGMHIYDDAQQCCENRYLTTSDDLDYFVGSTFIDMGVETAPYIEDDMEGVHEVQFLHVKTSWGIFVVETHNEHNGYYGGFNLVINPILPSPEHFITTPPY